MSNFEICKNVLDMIIETTVYPSDSEPNFAIEIFSETLNVFQNHDFKDGIGLSTGDLIALIIYYSNAFDYRFGNGAYRKIAMNESDDSDDPVIFDDGSEYDF